MKNLEIILQDFPKDKLDKFIFEEFKINSSDVKSSHFYDGINKQDIEFHQVNSLQQILSPIGTGNIFMKQVELGYILRDVMVILSFDEYIGDITLNFLESELFTNKDSETKQKAKNIVETLIYLKNKYGIPTIRIGFEPAADDDDCLAEISGDVVDDDLESIVKQITS